MLKEERKLLREVDKLRDDLIHLTAKVRSINNRLFTYIVNKEYKKEGKSV